MEHDQEMTEVFEEEPEAMDISDGIPMEQRMLSDEITKNISAIINGQVEEVIPAMFEKIRAMLVQ